MTTKQLGYQAPPSLAIAEGATTPNPGIVGVSVWSTTLSRLVTWNGTLWDSGMVQRSELDVSTAGQAVLRKVIAGTGITLSATGIDAGTGDVTINSTGGGGGGAPAGNPVSVGSVGTGAYPKSVFVSGKYAYVCNYSGNNLQVVDISTPASPVVVGTVATGSNPNSVYVSGRYAYVCNYISDTLQVFDVSNPVAPVAFGSVSVGAGYNPASVYVSGRYVYVCNNATNFLQVIDVYNPAAPVVVGSVSTGASTNPISVYVSGRYAYVCNRTSNTLQVVDISSPTAPTLLGSVATASSPQSVFVAGQYAYVVNQTSGSLQVFDVSNPAAPVAVGTVSTGSTPNSVYVSGRYAYVASSGTNTLQAFDIGGFDYVAANVSSLEVGNVKVVNDLQIGGQLSVAGTATTRELTANTVSLTGVDPGITLSVITNEPPTPPAGTIKVYAKSIAGRIWPKWIGPSGWDMPIQQALMFNSIIFVKPATAATQTVVGTAVTNVGTLTTPALATGNLLNSTRRTLITAPATTAGTLISQRAASTLMWRGNAAGLGGFVYGERFSLAVLVAGQRVFVGIADSIAAPTNIDPNTSTAPGKIGLAVNANTGNWNLVYNVTGSAPTVVALGANFPVNVTDILDLVLFSPPNGTYIGYRVKNMTSGVEVSGTLTTNIPSNTTFLAPWKFMTNNATAATFAMNSLGFTVETDQ